jgi:SpoVK/Ycf46/Vps4 family AAA+-type ATPase
MAMNAVQLHEEKHPNDSAVARYDSLVGIDGQKADLSEYLLRVFDSERLSRWVKKHHPKGLPLTKRIEDRAPLVVLAGEVGCGKTALATSVGSVVATTLDKRVVALETPSDIRGGGLVGQLSERVTAAFNEARVKVGKDRGILIIDEGDDLGTSRAQMQAHHEDRAGLNVLIKEIDRLARDRSLIAVVLITNRLQALDPALVRRAHVIRFERPDAAARRALFERLLQGVQHDEEDITALVRASERNPPFSYSDLVERGAEGALLASLREDRPLSAATLRKILGQIQPTPLIEDKSV